LATLLALVRPATTRRLDRRHDTAPTWATVAVGVPGSLVGEFIRRPRPGAPWPTNPRHPKRVRSALRSLGPPRVTLAERDTTSTAVSDRAFCSWACSREFVIRFVRFGRDDD
jgi:hypothetical protein